MTEKPQALVPAREGFKTYRQRGIRLPDGTRYWAEDLNHPHAVHLPREAQVSGQSPIHLPQEGISSASASSWATYVEHWHKRLDALGIPREGREEPTLIRRTLGVIVQPPVTEDDEPVDPLDPNAAVMGLVSAVSEHNTLSVEVPAPLAAALREVPEKSRVLIQPVPDLLPYFEHRMVLPTADEAGQALADVAGAGLASVADVEASLEAQRAAASDEEVTDGERQFAKESAARITAKIPRPAEGGTIDPGVGFTLVGGDREQLLPVDRIPIDVQKFKITDDGIEVRGTIPARYADLVRTTEGLSYSIRHRG